MIIEEINEGINEEELVFRVWNAMVLLPIKVGKKTKEL